MAHNWTADEDTYLREIFSQGSHVWIAQQVNQKFGLSVTRNSVIGRCGRLKLFKLTAEDFERARVNGHLPRKSRKIKEARPKRTREPRKKIPRTKDGSSGRKVIKLFDDYARTDHLGIRLADLEPHHCRFPVGEGLETTFCGHPVIEGQSYCERCYDLCYVPPRIRERTAA